MSVDQYSSTQAGSQPADTSALADSERMFGVVRTFGITNDKNALRLRRVASSASSGKMLPTRSHSLPPEFRKRFGASFADYAIGEFMSTYAFPSMLHEDPRYFREGEGNTEKLVGHAIASAFVTRKDSGASFIQITPIPWEGLQQALFLLCITPQKIAVWAWCSRELESASCSERPGQSLPSLFPIFSKSCSRRGTRSEIRRSSLIRSRRPARPWDPQGCHLQILTGVRPGWVTYRDL